MRGCHFEKYYEILPNFLYKYISIIFTQYKDKRSVSAGVTRFGGAFCCVRHFDSMLSHILSFTPSTFSPSTRTPVVAWCQLANSRGRSRQPSVIRLRRCVPSMLKEGQDTTVDDSNKDTNQGSNIMSSPKLPETPCFTARILSSPMQREDRQVYLDSVTEAVDAYLSKVRKSETPEQSPIGQVTLLVPQLNPSLDVYDRRFLLQLTWAVLSSTVTQNSLRTRVLIQGRRAFGAIPLSVSGLRQHFDADLAISAANWSRSIRSGELENEADLDDNDDAIIVVSPTNAVSIPVIIGVTDLFRRARGRPIILINPRLGDVPSHSGVMQVSGRSDRIGFLQRIDEIFYLRLLYDPGMSYPLRGILFRTFPYQWQIWNHDDKEDSYAMIWQGNERPDVSQISDAFKNFTFACQKVLFQQASLEMTSVEVFLKPQFLILTILIIGLIAALLFNSTFYNGYLVTLATLST